MELISLRNSKRKLFEDKFKQRKSMGAGWKLENINRKITEAMI
jgi:hypothetical protein